MTEQLSLDDAPTQRPLRQLPDIGRWHKGGTDTERSAAEAIGPVVGTQRDRVLAAYLKAGSSGLTDYECHALARLTYPHIAGTRREELIAAGVPIADSNERRQTPSGRLAIVWKLEQQKGGQGNGRDPA